MMAERTFGQRCLKVGSADKVTLAASVANARFSNAALTAKRTKCGEQTFAASAACFEDNKRGDIRPYLG